MDVVIADLCFSKAVVSKKFPDGSVFQNIDFQKRNDLGIEVIVDDGDRFIICRSDRTM